jgi:hypothetical protein
VNVGVTGYKQYEFILRYLKIIKSIIKYKYLIKVVPGFFEGDRGFAVNP